MADVKPKPETAKPAAALGIPPAPAKDEKRAISYAAKPANAADNRSRFAALKTFLWVAPLTALIWIYAEREQIDRIEVRVPITLISTSTDRVITVVTPTDRYVSLDVQGPRASLGELRDTLAKGPLEVNVSPEVPYEGDISITEAITKSDIFKSHAVTVVAARPPIKIKVEPKIARRVKVQARPQDRLVGPPPVFEPDSVVIEGPKDALEKIKPEDLVALADLSDFKRKAPASYVQDVFISLPTPVEHVTMPRTVRARVTIVPSETAGIPPIPIVINISGLVLSSDKYRITTKETLNGVEVTGPPDAIDSLKKRDFPAAVVVDLTKENFDAIQGTVDRAQKIEASNYRMPPGVTVVNPDREINITISKRGG